MADRRLVAVGTATTTFLVVAGAITGALESRIAFSVLVGLPIGMLVGLLAGLVAYRASPGLRGVRRGLLDGFATVGPTALGLFAVRYAIASTRGLLSGRVVMVVAILAGVIVAAIEAMSE